jgi:4-hydroxybenzoate polyprenyltransferase
MDYTVRRAMATAGALVRALRPHHWVKNSVVVAAPLFALALHPAALARVAWAFVAFSGVASAFYLINDVRDRAADRQHPVKQHRPIAAGDVSVPLALTTAAGLLGISIGASYFVAPLLAGTLAAYALLQTGYNLGLKRLPILDIMVIAGGFVLRAVAGAAAAQVPVSEWFLLCVGLLAFFLGVEKRKAELETAGPDSGTRTVMRAYTEPVLDRMASVVTAAALMAYALWTIEGAGTPWMMATLPFVAYAIFRYQYLADRMQIETPEEVLVRDAGMVATVVLWALVSLGILLLTGAPS